MKQGMRVSGVGAGAKRTDLDRARKIQREAKIQNATGGAYRERTELTELAQGASTNVPPVNIPAPAAVNPLANLGSTDIFAPTARPEEPVSAGAAGNSDGPGPDVLPTPVTAPDQLAVLARAMFAADPTPQNRRLLEAFMQEGR